MTTTTNCGDQVGEERAIICSDGNVAIGVYVVRDKTIGRSSCYQDLPLMRRADFLRCVDVIYHQRGVDQNDMEPTTTNNERRNADEEEMMMWYGVVGSTIYYTLLVPIYKMIIINMRYEEDEQQGGEYNILQVKVDGVWLWW